MDRLYVSYEKYRRMIAEKKILHRLVQGVRILTVALACYGWWGVIYPELTMLPSTYGSYTRRRKPRRQRLYRPVRKW